MKAKLMFLCSLLLILLVMAMGIAFGCVHHKKGARQSHKKVKALRKNNKHFVM